MDKLGDLRGRVAQGHRERLDMKRGIVWRWNPAKGTGVVRTDPGTLVWFHISALDDGTADIGMPVDIEVDPTPQGSFSCRAFHVTRSIPASWHN
ncbi:hypothetical protein HGA13_25155 [Nocardia speluncae]|uniref:CSD domain-containing protein n=1 Tax=Nocardia speluncae TaxID=419477 RepID=A0A846XNT6_9NOCA|nr:hypothetical protein [Nocardia speluncae]NKY36330.1 hypothetical protein [Nocardia speluncae]